MKTWFGNSRTGFWAKGRAWVVLSSEVPREQTDSVKFDFASGLQFLNLCGFEHLLPLLPSSISLPSVLLLFFRRHLPLLTLLFSVPEADIFIPY